MAKNPTVVNLYYDIISPYSYLAFEVLNRYKDIWNLDLKLKPVLLGGVMKASGNSPPAVVPNKGVYMAQDLKRLQKYFQIPLFVPSNLMDLIMKKGSLNAQRFITAVDILNPRYTEDISRALWSRLYEFHKDIIEVESFIEAARSIGMEEDLIEKVISTMDDQTTKDRLRKYTEEALDYGAFGAPMIVAHVNGQPEVFFGSDRFELLAYVLGKTWNGPVPQLPSKL